MDIRYIKRKVYSVTLIVTAIFMYFYCLVPYKKDRYMMDDYAEAVYMKVLERTEPEKAEEIKNLVVEEDPFANIVIPEQVATAQGVEVKELPSPVPVDNGDLVARITIDCCDIDYPVYTNEEENYYLRTDARGVYSVRGCIYTNDYTADMMIIYGHNMNDGSMFSGLIGCVPGAIVKIQDMTYSDYKTTEYDVVENTVLSASDLYEYVYSTDADVVLVTCSGQVKDGRRVVLLKEKVSAEEGLQ